MRVLVSDDSVEVLLAPWQRVLGLMRDVHLARAAVGDVRVVREPVREAMSAGIKVGLRVPWLYYAARTIRLDQLFLVRRGVPALSFSVNGAGPLRRVLVSTRDADALAARLRSG